MSEPTVPHADPAELDAALADAAGAGDLAGRLDRLSARFLGRPYHPGPLIGGPLIGSAEIPEQMVTQLVGFDCVTFGESVLALGWSRRAADYEPNLAAIRYLEGRQTWLDRNHYMTTWVERNVRAGHVSPVLPNAWVWGAARARYLSVLPEYPTLRWRPRYLPSRRLDLLAEHAHTGDLVAFVSNKPNLDTFHVGLLVQGEQLAVRHASRSAGCVIHQDLGEFLTKADVPGMLVVRPSEQLSRGEEL